MKNIGLAATYGLLILILLVSCGPASQDAVRTETPPAQITSEPTGTATSGQASLPDLRHLPLYPGAQQVESEAHEKPTWSSISFKTPDSDQKVTAYYKEQLSRQGWVFTSGSSVSDEGLAMNFLWTGAGATNADLNVGIDRGDPAQAGTSVHLFARLWPDPNKIPLYAGAQQVEVTNIPSTDQASERITTYVTNSRPEDIEKYYKATLPSQGWESDPVSTSTITSAEGIEFSFVRGTSYMEGLGGHAGITARPGIGGQTQVTITAIATAANPIDTPRR